MEDVIPNDGIGELAAALAKAQATMKPAAMDRKNTHLNSKYSTLTAVWDACREALTANGLAVVQMPMMAEEGWLGLETRLMHSSGQQVSSVFKAPIQIPLNREGKPTLTEVQAYGSAITYMRRYALASMVGVVADEDGDGHTDGHTAPRSQNAPQASRGDRSAPPAAAEQRQNGQAPAESPQEATAAIKCRDLYRLTLCPLIGAEPLDTNTRLETWERLLGRGWPTEPTQADWEVLAMVLQGEIDRLNAEEDPFQGNDAEPRLQGEKAKKGALPL